MFIGEEPEFGPEEHRMSFLSMFMRIDRRFMGKCFGQMQELGIYPGNDYENVQQRLYSCSDRGCGRNGRRTDKRYYKKF